ncbi:MAG: hypothetical protein WBC33_10090, partial [Conexibacter sp.]
MSATAKHAIARVGDRGIAVRVAFVVAIALVAWPVRSLEPGTSADWNWAATLFYAAEHGLNFGEQIAWSYGPLGFLSMWSGPVLFYDDLLLLSWLSTFLIHLSLAGTLLVALRRSLPLAGAAVVAVVVLALVPEQLPALGFAWCVLALTREDGASQELASKAFPLALGALVGVSLLNKLNVGAELIVLAALALAAAPRRR